MDIAKVTVLAPFLFSFLLVVFGDFISNRVVNDVPIDYYKGGANTGELKDMIKWNYQLSSIQIAIPTALISLLTMTIPTGNSILTIILVTSGIVIMFFNGQIRHKWRTLNPYDPGLIVNRKLTVKFINLLLLIVSLYISLSYS